MARKHALREMEDKGLDPDVKHVVTKKGRLQTKVKKAKVVTKEVVVTKTETKTADGEVKETVEKVVTKTKTPVDDDKPVKTKTRTRTRSRSRKKSDD